MASKKKPKKATAAKYKEALAAKKRADACDALTAEAQRNGEYDPPKRRPSPT